jgi:hypothetical protein
VDGRLEQRDPETVKALPNPPKGKVWSTRPRYPTVWAAMGTKPPERAEDRLAKDAERLADDLIASGAEIDWERPETWPTTPDGGFPA